MSLSWPTPRRPACYSSPSHDTTAASLRAHGTTVSYCPHHPVDSALRRAPPSQRSLRFTPAESQTPLARRGAYRGCSAVSLLSSFLLLLISPAHVAVCSRLARDTQAMRTLRPAAYTPTPAKSQTGRTSAARSRVARQHTSHSPTRSHHAIDRRGCRLRQRMTVHASPAQTARAPRA
ncbi:hypothetical protein C8J57DRAFT_146360 [Mycena rebaudengoi]|nr:hypothetical protein C8J57DRAFT_146360 [Mycena rebaudengoi]